MARSNLPLNRMREIMQQRPNSQVVPARSPGARGTPSGVAARGAHTATRRTPVASQVAEASPAPPAPSLAAARDSADPRREPPSEDRRPKKRRLTTLAEKEKRTKPRPEARGIVISEPSAPAEIFRPTWSVRVDESALEAGSTVGSDLVRGSTLPRDIQILGDMTSLALANSSAQMGCQLAYLLEGLRARVASLQAETERLQGLLAEASAKASQADLALAEKAELDDRVRILTAQVMDAASGRDRAEKTAAEAEAKIEILKGDVRSLQEKMDKSLAIMVRKEAERIQAAAQAEVSQAVQAYKDSDDFAVDLIGSYEEGFFQSLKEVQDRFPEADLSGITPSGPSQPLPPADAPEEGEVVAEEEALADPTAEPADTPTAEEAFPATFLQTTLPGGPPKGNV